MGPDNADLAGPWQLMTWPRQTPMSGWAEDIRLMHVRCELPALELIDGPWSCARHEFREEGLFLDLTLVHAESGRTVAGTFDLEDGVWAPADGAGQMTIAEFHRAYAAVNSPPTTWPVDPFREVRPPSGVDAASADGAYLIDLTTNRWRMSDWICPPRIVHLPTGDCLLDLKTTYWDARAEFRPPPDGRAELRLLQYPGTKYSLRLELDLPRERYRIIEGSHDGLSPEGYLDELQAALGRPPADLDELGILLDVRESRRGAGDPSRRPLHGVAEPKPPPRGAEPAPPGPSTFRTPAPEPEFHEDDLLGPEDLARPESIAGPAPEPPAGDDPPARQNEGLPGVLPFSGLRDVGSEGEPPALGPDLGEPPPVSPSDLRDVVDAITIEVAKRGLQGRLQYEMIVIGVLRAAAAGITRAADAVAILETLAMRRGELGKDAA